MCPPVASVRNYKVYVYPLSQSLTLVNSFSTGENEKLLNASTSHLKIKGTYNLKTKYEKLALAISVSINCVRGSVHLHKT